MSRLFLTCPIFYANAKPHLGHAYTLCLADAWARYARIRGSPSLSPFYVASAESPLTKLKKQKPVQTFLSSGLDEHGIKVKQAAVALRKTPQEFCDEIYPLFKELCEVNSVALNDFIRTTEARHCDAVHEFWSRLQKSNTLYESGYSGWYSVTDEAFYSDWEIKSADSQDQSAPAACPAESSKRDDTKTKKYVAKETGSPVEWMEEKNFIFKLSAFKKPLHDWLDSGVFASESPSQMIWQKKAHDLVEKAVDMSVSRSTERLDWGVQVPEHPEQTIYVWVDALINYLTASGFPSTEKKSPEAPVPSWPPDIQFFGKDILKFHAVLWPALLMAADLPLPRQLICHHHLLVDGHKMSKSWNNILDPFEEQRALLPSHEHKGDQPGAASEGLRYVLLRLSLLNADAVYNRSLAQQVINTELVNNVGNLLSRVTSTRLNPTQSVMRITREEAGAVFNQREEDIRLLDSMDVLAAAFDESWWCQLQPHAAAEQVLSMVHQTNALLDRHKPWDHNSEVEREYVISLCAESLRLAGILLQPVVPTYAKCLLRRLGVYQPPGETIKERLKDKLFWSLGPDEGPLLRRLS
ncbi:unnamed protein product [Calicophoron daubneyi]|uniref:Methionine--tRNA ligase, mitochondrial n=1 Tax=Calicophoron daubneyi TaxID=300641 RepID=A0AAV2TNA6_CALDB